MNFWEVSFTAEIDPLIESIGDNENRAFLEGKVQNFTDNLIKLTEFLFGLFGKISNFSAL